MDIREYHAHTKESLHKSNYTFVRFLNKSLFIYSIHDWFLRSSSSVELQRRHFLVKARLVYLALWGDRRTKLEPKDDESVFLVVNDSGNWLSEKGGLNECK